MNPSRSQLSKRKIILGAIILLVILASVIVYWYYQRRVIEIEQDIQELESEY